MLLHSRGIVLRAIRYAETSLIADIFTEAYGLRTFIAGSVRTPRARMAQGLFQPMQPVELVAYFKDKPDALNRLKELRAGQVFHHIHADIRKGAVLLFCAEVCRKCVQEADENRDLFAFLISFLEWLDREEVAVALAPQAFLIGCSRYLGFHPEDPGDNTNLCFDLVNGIFGKESDMQGPFLSPSISAHMLQIMRSAWSDLNKLDIRKEERKQLLEALILFYQQQVSGFSDVHTPEVMEWVWGGR
jgi:DNA repair protein RecO (recombination protein O)